MNSQEIIDYVMNTPSNTNPAILKQMIDANSSGGVTSWNDLEDKPFDAIEERVLIAKTFANKGFGGPFIGALPEYGTSNYDGYVLNVSALIPGDTYIAIVNGEEYIGVAESCEDTSSDGNRGIRLFDHGEYPTDFSDAPISLSSYSNQVYIEFENENSSYDVELYHHKTMVKTLDPKFLPNGGVTSWNDLTDKPFGEEVVIETVTEPEELVLSDTIYTGSGGRLDEKSEDGAQFSEKLTNVNNELYKVVLNGEIYSDLQPYWYYDSYEDDEFLAISNDSVPFTLYGDYGWYLRGRIGTLDDQEYSIEIYKQANEYEKETEIIKTLDPKYLPKPLQFGKEVTEVELDNEVFTFDAPKDFKSNDNMWKLVVGQEYTVMWNGVEYVRIARELKAVDNDWKTGIGLGNVAAAGEIYTLWEGEDTGEPFFLQIDGNDGFISSAEAGEVHFILKTVEEVVTPIADEFIPDSVFKNGDTRFCLQSPNGNRFWFMVNDEGELVPWEK